MYEDILYEYEMILLNKKSNFSQFLFTENGEEKAFYVIRFSIKNYLRWSDENVIKHFNWNIIQLLKLDTLMRYINFPPDLDNNDNVTILLSKLYPNLVSINEDEYTIKSFKKSLEKDVYKIPNNYLSRTPVGAKRAIVCLRYVLKELTDLQTSQEVYSYFTSTKCKNTLKKYRLNVACNDIFEYPIDFLHAALPKTKENEFWYRYYRFKVITNEEYKLEKQREKNLYHQ